MTARCALSLAVALVAAAATPARAQTVSATLDFLVTNHGVETGSVERDRQAALATSQTISRAILINLATLPVPTSSSGFVYRLNPELGTVERVSDNFGPFFVERALTAGPGQVSFGLAFQHLRFTSLDGRSLRDGSLVTTANQFVDETTPFDVDRLTLAIDASLVTFYGNVGVTDAIEVGFAVPMVSLRLDGSRINTYRGNTFTQASAHAESLGLADVVVRTKLTAFNRDGAALAGAVDLRLLTGRTEDLLGAGSRSLKLAAIGSLERHTVSAHANLGVTVGGLAREVSYGGAVGVAATGRMTIVGELLGRRVDSPGGMTSVASPHPTLAGVETIRLLPTDSALNTVTVVPGFKWNVSSTWVLAGNLSVPVTSHGLVTSITPFIGFDYALGR